MFNNITKLKDNKRTNQIAALVVFLFFAAYYFIILYLRVSTDIQAHAAIAYSFAVNNDKLTPNFLYFILVALFSGFSNYYPLYYVASIILLAGAITAKFLLNDRYLKKYGLVTGNKLLSFTLAFTMLFVFALPGLNFFQVKDFYLGQLVPNVWHNSTVIFLMPFAILLFFKSYELLFLNSAVPNKKLLIQVAVLIIINVLIKPSFLFTLLPSVFIFFCYRKWFLAGSHNKLGHLLPYIFGLLFIVLEYYIIYRLNYTSSVTGTGSESSKVILAPFKVWRHFSSSMVIAVITSLFFPLVYLAVSKGQVMKNTIVQFAVVNFVTGLSIWILFAEQGGRMFHGNFFWQVVVACYLLFFSLLLHFAQEVKLNKISYQKQWIIGVTFLLHFIWGAFYWFKIIIFNGYS
jgi:hypothetical protein